jgi:hypothetical protein
MSDGQETLNRPARLIPILSTLADHFSNEIRSLLSSGALEGSFADFVQLSGKNLEMRTRSYNEWRSNRLRHGLWPFSTELQSGPGPEVTVVDETGKQRTGVNFASYDYLGLSAHSEVRA